jgi:hypothetical protein
LHLAESVSREHSKLSPSAQSALVKEGLHNKENTCLAATSNASSATSDESDVVEWQKPRIMLADLTLKEVKRRTGFHDLKHLLTYNAVVYGGDLAGMAKTVTKLTLWIEEFDSLSRGYVGLNKDTDARF